MNGFIQLHRQFLEWEWYQDTAVKAVFVHMLLTVSFKPSQWKGIDIQPGQVVTSYSHLAAQTGLTVQQVRTAVKKLISTGEITSSATNKYTIITVVKWAFYQSLPQEITSTSTSNATNNQHSNNNQITINQQHLNKDNKDNKDNNSFLYASGKQKKPVKFSAEKIIDDFTSDSELKSALMDFVKMRKDIKKPITTERALTGALKKLSALSDNIAEQIEIVNLAVERNWLSFYKPEIKQNTVSGGKPLTPVQEMQEETLNFLLNDRGGC